MHAIDAHPALDARIEIDEIDIAAHRGYALERIKADDAASILCIDSGDL